MSVRLVVLLAVLGCAIDAAFLMMPKLLARRGVTMRRTRFGVALVFDGESVEGDEVRMLNVNGTFQSVSYTAAGRQCGLACLYHQYFAEVIDVAGLRAGGGEGLSALVIGGGGFSFPKWMVSSLPSAQVEVAEIDPKIIEIAREFFFLDELERRTHAERDGRLRVSCCDGWARLAEAGERWGLVVNDAFSGKRPLGPLGTVTGAQAIREHLTDDGIYLANLISPMEGRGSRVMRETLAAFGREFPYVYLIPERPEEPRRAGDNTLVASMRPLGIAARYRVRATGATVGGSVD